MSVQETIPRTHLKEIGERYGVEPKGLIFVGGFENSVYSFSKKGQELFLRVGSSKHMTLELVQAEIEWVRYLVEKGVPAVKPAPSVADGYVERVDLGKVSYNVVAFEKAKGEHIKDGREPLKWNREMIRDWGRVIGRMHSVTKDFKPKSSRRYDYNPGLDSFLYKNESKKIREYIDGLWIQLGELPKSNDSYGLVHSDIHTGNFFVRNNKISAILDFDRSCYKWFISELAIALYYPTYLSELRNHKGQQKKFVRDFVSLFMEGYETENQLDSKWLEHLDFFIRVREVILLMYSPNEDWRKPLRPRISGKEPYLDVFQIIS
ncbi:MAG: phosphotransferase [Candidatus Thorarchaeota archaeon]|jgi:Ser/Thr protein kinase RdoA (MazF antagonist)